MFVLTPHSGSKNRPSIEHAFERLKEKTLQQSPGPLREPPPTPPGLNIEPLAPEMQGQKPDISVATHSNVKAGGRG